MIFSDFRIGQLTWYKIEIEIHVKRIDLLCVIFLLKNFIFYLHRWWSRFIDFELLSLIPNEFEYLANQVNWAIFNSSVNKSILWLNAITLLFVEQYVNWFRFLVYPVGLTTVHAYSWKWKKKNQKKGKKSFKIDSLTSFFIICAIKSQSESLCKPFFIRWIAINMILCLN